jgi:EmrB/QacA subfamily drug resistance transporter
MANIVRQPCDEGVIAARVAATPCTKASGPWILAATILGSSMTFIDGTAVNVALPALQANLNATVGDVQWVVESYALFLAALLLVGGSLGDHHGRKLIFSIGVAFFALASVWCGLAPNISQLIAARAIQGVGAALLVPGSLAIISASFSKEDRGQAIGTWSGFTAITGAAGPVLSGWLIENVSWRAVFFINVPLAGIVLALVFWRVPESRDEKAGSGSDWLGATLATLSLAAIVYGLIESSFLGFGSLRVLTALILGALASAFFIFVEAKKKDAMMPLSLFRSQDFSGANLLTLFLYAALAGSATAAGAALLPLILIMFLLSRWAGGLVTRFGARLPLMIGPVVTALGFTLFTMPGTHGSYWSTFFPAVLVLGFGMTISVAPLTTTVMNAVAKNLAGTASGVNNAVSRTAGLIAVAALGLVMLHVFNNRLDRRLSGLAVSNDVQHALDAQRVKLAGAVVPSNLDPAVQTALRQAIKESFVSGFRAVMSISAALAVLSGLIAWLLIRGSATAPT